MAQEAAHRPDRPFLSRCLRIWLSIWGSVSGLCALAWLILRSGTKPSRLTYPCQQAALTSAWLAFAGPLLASVDLLRRMLRRPAFLALGACGLLAAAGIWVHASRTSGYRGPRPPLPQAYRAQLYHVTQCPQNPIGDRFPGLDCLVNLMGQGGLKLHNSPTVTQTSGPSGIIHTDSVVVIKINYQWVERGGSNTDVLRGLIRWIVDHPDGFTGEVLVCENSQWQTIDNFDRLDNNAQDTTQSPRDVVTYFAGLGYKVGFGDWWSLQSIQVNEYSTGDMADGYVVYPYDPVLDGAISYPKFQTGFGSYVSLRDGIWDTTTSTYDRSKLKVINLPVLKSHFDYGATACIKHYMGTVTYDLSTNSHNAIANGILGATMGAIRPPDLDILDAIWINAQPAVGPPTSYTDATRRDELVASQDPVATDIWSVKNILIPGFLANGYSPPWSQYGASADPDDVNSEFRRYLDASMNRLLAAGFDTTNDLTQIDVTTQACGATVRNPVVTGPGPAGTNAPLVRTWDLGSPPAMQSAWTAYGTNQAGVNVGGADIVAGGDWEVLTGPGPGPVFGPQIRAYDRTGAPFAKVNFYAYGTLRYGAHGAGGDIDGDAHHEILSSPGPGAVFGPHIRGWNFDGATLTAIGKVSFFAYSTLRYGARVAGGDLDADSYAELVTGAGAGAAFGPHVRGFDYDGGTITAMPISFFAFGSGRDGVCVAAGDAYGDGSAEIVAAPGPDPTMPADVAGFSYSGSVAPAFNFSAFPLSGGAEVASADLDNDALAEVIAGAGWGAANAPSVDAFRISGTNGTPIPGFAFDAYTGMAYGTKVAIIQIP